MKRILSSALLILFILSLSACALADRMYLLPDSDKRRLTEEEVAVWNYDSLGYAFNEIMARHGYCFNAGQKYDSYFSTMPWYTPNQNPDKQLVYEALSDVEWYNYEVIKSVRAQKKHNDWGASLWDSYSAGFDTLQGFDYVELSPNQSLDVYSAPSTMSWRGANGKAKVSTNGAVYAAGWESGWLLVMYETNNGSVRVGYVDASQLRGRVPVDKQLAYAYTPATVLKNCNLTDDPARTNSTITTLRAGTQVTFLTCYFNRSAWDYVETTVDGRLVRGFVKAGCIDAAAEDPLDDDALFTK